LFIALGSAPSINGLIPRTFSDWAAVLVGAIVFVAILLWLTLR
jgi:hypothetical protein